VAQLEALVFLDRTLKLDQGFELLILFVHGQNMAQYVFDDMLFTEVANDIRVRLAAQIEPGLHIEVCLLEPVRGHQLEVPFAVRALVTQHLGENGFGLRNDFRRN
jgi:hypothetical protein